MSAWTDVIQAGAAVINIGVVGFIAFRQGSSLRKQTKQRASNIAGLLTFQLSDIAMALGYSNKDPRAALELSKFANLNLSRHISDELIIEYLDIVTTQEIFEFWDELALLQIMVIDSIQNPSDLVTEAMRGEFDIVAKYILDLNIRLAKLSGYKVRVYERNEQNMTTT